MAVYREYIVLIEHPDGGDKYLTVRATSDKSAETQALKTVAHNRWSSEWYVKSTTRCS